MSDQVKAGFASFLFVLITAVLGYATSLLDRVDDWLSEALPGNDALIDSGKALAFALAVWAVNSAYRWLQTRWTWLPGTPPTYAPKEG